MILVTMVRSALLQPDPSTCLKGRPPELPRRIFPKIRAKRIALGVLIPYHSRDNLVGILSRVAEGLGPVTPQQPVGGKDEG